MKELTANEWVNKASKNVKLMIKMKDDILNRNDISEETRKILLKELKMTMDKYIITFKKVLDKSNDEV